MACHLSWWTTRRPGRNLFLVSPLLATLFVILCDTISLFSCTSASQHPHQSQMIPRRHHFKPAPQPTVQVLQPPDEDAPSLTITMLGAGQEVGRSCCVIEHRGKKIVCDAGLHPAQPGIGALPFIDELDWSTVDALLITQ